MERVGAAIIGGGAVGCAVALELARSSVTRIVLLERMPGVGEVQSGRSSGVVHAGIYYRNGSLKAQLCVDANPRMYEFCRAHGVAIEQVGKLVVACDSEEELPRLERIHSKGRDNGVPGLRMLTAGEITALEPNVRAVAALHVPTTGIVDAASYTRALAGLAEEAGVTVLTSFEVTSVQPAGGDLVVTGARNGREESLSAELVINAAGLGCAAVGRMVNPELDVEVLPLRGEYYKVNRRRRAELWLNGLNIYPIPERFEVDGDRTKMVGVHLTPSFALARDGSVEIGDTIMVGPEFRLAPSVDDYESDRLPPDHFADRARRFFPALERDDLEIDFAGIMVRIRGQNDWRIERDAQHADCVQLLGIDSPGLTCSLAIARHVRNLLET